MPQQPKPTVTWDQLSAEQKGAVIRQYGGPEYEAVLATGNGGAGFTDEQLGNTPVLWPPVTDSNGDPINGASDADPNKDFDDYGDYYLGTLRSEGNPTVLAIDEGTWEPGPDGKTIATGEDYGDPSTDPNATNRGFHNYDPNRTLTKEDMETFRGVAPGITLDLEQYGPDEQHALDQQKLREMSDYYRGLDPNRWAINPEDIPQLDTYTYDPATADIYTTEVGDTFDPTLDQLGYANDLNDYALNLDGSHLGQAADLQYAAASGKTPLVSDLRLDRDRDALYSQQLGLSARARGSSGAGLAVLNAQNNSQLGYLGLVQAADLARAQEMTDARNAYASTGATIRQGDLQGASQATDIADKLFGVGSAELGVATDNTHQLNAGEQYNTGVENDAAKYGADAATAAGQYNIDNTKDILEKNRVAGMTTETSDRGFTQAYDGMTIDQDEKNRGARIQGEEDYQHGVNDTASILSNTYLGVGNTRTEAAGYKQQADSQETGAWVGAIGAGIGALVASDRRLKDIHGPAEPADFSRVHDYDWSYDESVPPEDDWLNDGSTKSGMAQDFPDDLVFKDDQGNLRVNAMKALLRYAGSIGDLQRRVEKVEKR